MLKVINSRKSKYYRVMLEGFGKDTNEEGFYSNNYSIMYNEANPEEFGFIIVEKRMDGYHEIITGIKMPLVEYIGENGDNILLSTPNTSYRVKNLVSIDKNYLDNYILRNNNDEFKENINKFIQESNNNKAKRRSLN